MAQQGVKIVADPVSAACSVRCMDQSGSKALRVLSTFCRRVTDSPEIGLSSGTPNYGMWRMQAYRLQKLLDADGTRFTTHSLKTAQETMNEAFADLSADVTELSPPA